jgi:hypothetical protein
MEGNHSWITPVATVDAKHFSPTGKPQPTNLKPCTANRPRGLIANSLMCRVHSAHFDSIRVLGEDPPDRLRGLGAVRRIKRMSDVFMSYQGALEQEKRQARDASALQLGKLHG